MTGQKTRVIIAQRVLPYDPIEDATPEELLADDPDWEPAD